MAIKFEFTLEDTEAETLISLLNNESLRMFNESRKALITEPEEKRQAISDWCMSHSRYIESIKEKMLASQLRV